MASWVFSVEGGLGILRGSIAEGSGFFFFVQLW